MLKGSWRRALAGSLTGLSSRAGDRDPLADALGRLEREVMDVVWRLERVSVRDAQAALPRSVAYTTVMTTLDRLFKKGLLQRTRDGRAFVYHASCTREEAESAVASTLLRGLLTKDGAGARPLLSNLVDVLGERDAGLLDELEELLREKRRQNRQG